MRLPSVFIVLLLLVPACERPSEEDCQRICWKAGELAFRAKLEKKIADEADPESKQVLREEGEEEWQEIRKQTKNPEFERCSLTCQKKGRPSEVQCIDKAETKPAVDECLD